MNNNNHPPKPFIKVVFIVVLIALSSTSPIFAQQIERWKKYEFSLQLSDQNQPTKTISFSARFSNPDTTYLINGFYDGKGKYILRFMPSQIGVWHFITSSNVPKLNGVKGKFECVAPSSNNHGPVRVSDTYHFKYADGKFYYPFGTTAYAWTHMGMALEEITLKSLRTAGFNKLRMCVFPKNYELVKEEPQLYPFQIKELKKDKNGKETITWDFEQFNPLFFQHLEKKIEDLDEIGIQADLILFHPYDKGRWGFDAMPNEVNIKYLNYLVARLSAYKNVWWSLANEWDYVKSKSIADWDSYAQLIAKSDPYRHPLSIHGATATYYNYWLPAFTHVSIQDETPVQNPASSAILRNIYQKPIISDEVGYEGNLKSRWGRYSGEEMNHLIWNGIIGGTYVTHGESYMFKNATDTIFWAKGGEFKGTSWKRIAFLRKIVEDLPAPLAMADLSRDYITASAGESNYLVYFGKEIKDHWIFNLPAKNDSYPKLTAGRKFTVDIIDCWEMTINRVPLTFETNNETDYRLFDKALKKVRLPLKPYIALKITEIR